VVIDSTLGSVIQSSGHYNTTRAVAAAKTPASSSVNTARSTTENGLGQLASGTSDLDELASTVWKYVKSTEALIADLDSEV
jgi:dynein light chain roadblock-type